jgi:hypothetical protein
MLFGALLASAAHVAKPASLYLVLVAFTWQRSPTPQTRRHPSRFGSSCLQLEHTDEGLVNTRIFYVTG